VIQKMGYSSSETFYLTIVCIQVVVYMQAVIMKYAQIFLTRIDPGCAQAVSY
jgi:hypothetical protein